MRIIHNRYQTRENRFESVDVTGLTGYHHYQLDSYQFGCAIFTASDTGEDNFNGHDVLIVVGAVIVQTILS